MITEALEKKGSNLQGSLEAATHGHIKTLEKSTADPSQVV